MNQERIKSIIEAALLVAGEPLSLDRLSDLFVPDHDEAPDRASIRDVLASLEADYRGRGVQLVEVASGYRLQTRADLAPWLNRLWEERPQRYSRALLETLAIIAYRQPITRGEIEDIRGVSISQSIMKTITEREWVRVVGHRDVPGRPAVYATTRQFLDYFGLKNLGGLPNLAALRDIDDLNLDLFADALDEPASDTRSDGANPPDANTPRAEGEANGDTAGVPAVVAGP